MSEKPLYKGITVPFNNAVGAQGFAPFTDEYYQRLKSWGLNCVCYVAFWGGDEHYGGLEPYEDRPGYYNEAALSNFETQLALARKYGLYPFLGIRVSTKRGTDYSVYDGWTRKYGCDILNMNDAGRQRFCDMLTYLAQRFPNMGFNAPHFPYHQQGAEVDQARIITYYNVTQPAIYNAIRSVRDVPIILVGIQQGFGRDYPGIPFGSGMARLRYQPFYNDPKVFYGVNSHDGGEGYEYGYVAISCHDWGYNRENLALYYKPAFDFIGKYPGARNKLFWVENIALNLDCEPGRVARQSRLDWMRESMDLQDLLGANWFYWSNWNGERPVLPDGSDSEVARILKEYSTHMPTPIPPLTALAWLASGLAPVITMGSVVTVQELKKIGIIP